jgi:hypothetical protein
MSSPRLRILAALLGAAFVAATATSATAQTNPDQKPQDQGQKPPGDKPAEPGKDDKKKVDEYAEAAQLISGPAGSPECVWLGRRVVNLLWRDDLDTAFRHLEIYDRFGCPGPHIQASFRCVVRQGTIDAKSPETQSTRVHACWINPSLPPTTAAAPSASGTPGTSSQ